MKYFYLGFSLLILFIFTNKVIAGPSVDVLKKYNAKNPITSRWGLEGNLDWNDLIDIVLKDNSKATESKIKQTYHIILGAKIGQGQETASYVLDLYKIFKQKPLELIEQSASYFKGINQCLIYWLVPKTQFIEYKEFTTDLSKALLKNPGNKKLVKFKEDAEKYYLTMKAGKSIPSLQKCNFLAIKQQN